MVNTERLITNNLNQLLLSTIRRTHIIAILTTLTRIII